MECCTFGWMIRREGEGEGDNNKTFIPIMLLSRSNGPCIAVANGSGKKTYIPKANNDDYKSNFNGHNHLDVYARKKGHIWIMNNNNNEIHKNHHLQINRSEIPMDEKKYHLMR